jgi:beta-glucanase (GH16 family)
MNVRKYCQTWFYCYLQPHQKINLNPMRAAYYLLAFILFLSACQKTDVSNNQLPKNSTIEGLTTASISTTSTCDFQLTETTLTGAGWTKVFDEDFSTDLSKWNVWYGGAYNNELQLYQAANLTLNSGILSIAAKKESKSGPVTPGSSTTKTFGFTSGRIESKTLFSANTSIPKVRFSARIKLPSGNGMWPAFWTYGDPWPTQGEIDILEAKGQEPTKFYTNYFYGTTAGTNLVSNSTSTITSSTSLQTCWHVYEMVWSATKLEFYLDGKLIETKTGTYIPSIFGKQEKITLNLAVGGNFFTGLVTSKIVTGTMLFDWVRVYTSN